MKYALGILNIALLQLFTRVFSFLFNILILRHSHVETIGIQSILLDSSLSSLLFISREHARTSLLRSNSTCHFINLSFLPLFIGFFISFLIASFTHEYRSFVIAYLFCGLLELSTEPFYIILQTKLEFGTRASIETFSFFIRCVVLSISSLSSIENGSISVESGLFSYCLSQCAYSVTLIFSYIYHFYKRNLLLEVIPNRIFDRDLFILSWSFFKQGVLKHVLTEGDKFMCLRFIKFDDAGSFAFSNNLGSLVARILFQPLEDTMRVYFSKSLTVGLFS